MPSPHIILLFITTACPKGLFGPFCQEVCTCENGGDCDPVYGACNCTAGYEGVNCTDSE